jgi:hypothetical protein
MSYPGKLKDHRLDAYRLSRHWLNRAHSMVISSGSEPLAAPCAQGSSSDDVSRPLPPYQKEPP